MASKKEPEKDMNIHQRIHAVMLECTYIKKDKKKGMQYSIVSHDVVTGKVRPYLVKHGIIYHPSVLSYVQNGNRTEMLVETTFVNIDNPDDVISCTTLGFGIDPQDKGCGKAMSYAVKYALLKTLGLETGEDADLDNIDHEPPTDRGKDNPPEPKIERASDYDMRMKLIGDWRKETNKERKKDGHPLIQGGVVMKGIKDHFNKLPDEMNNQELDELLPFIVSQFEITF